MAEDSTPNNSLGSNSGIVSDPGRRFPFVVSADGFKALSYLSEDDKRIGAEIFLRTQASGIEGVEQPPEHAAIQMRNPLAMFQSDPELFRCEIDYYDIMAKLVIGMDNDEIMIATGADGFQVKDPDIQHRYNTSQLMLTRLAFEYRVQWVLRLMATLPGWTISKEQFMCLDKPEASCWNDEDRLTLEFTTAVIRWQMTDELFARADAFWGRKQLVRYIKWITYYVSTVMASMINISDAEMAGPVKSPML